MTATLDVFPAARYRDVVEDRDFGDPGQRVGLRWTFDPVRGRTLLFGGTTSDVWELESANRAPSHAFRVSLEGAKIPSGSAFTGLTFSAVAGARGLERSGDGGWQRKDGIEVRPFVDGTFLRAPVWGMGSDTVPTRLSFNMIGPQLSRALEGQPAVYFALVPLGVNGNSTAVMATDYVETTVRYRLP